MPPPPILYKYRSLEVKEREHTLRAITHREIWFASLSSFNDPFEARVRLSMKGSNQAWRREIGVDRPNDNKIAAIIPLLEAGIREDAEKLGLFCLSAKCDDILMWSHYAGCHRGLCLGFRTTGESLLWDAQPVEYSIEYPLVERFGTTEKQRVCSMLLRKAEHWRYESEWRGFRAVIGPGLEQYPAGMLASVHLGAEIRKADRDTVLQAIAAVSPRVDVFQSRRSPDAYVLEVEAIQT